MREPVHGEDWPAGSIIAFADEKYRIRKNWGNSGEVECLNGELATNKFYWTYGGEQAQLISTPKETS